MRGAGLLRLGLMAALAAAAPCVAHTGGTTGFASISVERSAVRYTLVLPAAALPTEMAENLRLARDGNTHAAARLLDVVRRVVTLSGDGRRCEPGPGFVQPAASDAPSVTLLVDFACPAGFRYAGARQLHRRVERQRVAGTGAIPVRRDDQHFVAGATQALGEDADAGGVDAVIVADQDSHELP